MARRYRPRKLFKFWLYHDLAEDVRLMEYIDYLHKTRQFVTVLRNGLRLMWTLGQGDLSILFELFPTLRSQFAPDNSALIEEFRRMLQAQPQLAPRELVPAENARALPAPSVARHVFDEEDTIVIKTNTNAAAIGTANFLKAAFGISGVAIPANLDDIQPADPPASIPMSVLDDDDELPANLTPGSVKLKPLG